MQGVGMLWMSGQHRGRHTLGFRRALTLDGGESLPQGIIDGRRTASGGARNPASLLHWTTLHPRLRLPAG
jgi:hypothetical protein